MKYKYVVESFDVGPFFMLRNRGYLPDDYTAKIGVMKRATIMLDEEMDAETLSELEGMNSVAISFNEAGRRKRLPPKSTHGTSLRKIKVIQCMPHTYNAEGAIILKQVI